MKASEFVAQMQALIAKHGDLEVLCRSQWVDDQVAEAKASIDEVDSLAVILVLDLP